MVCRHPLTELVAALEDLFPRYGMGRDTPDHADAAVSGSLPSAYSAAASSPALNQNPRAQQSLPEAGPSAESSAVHSSRAITSSSQSAAAADHLQQPSKLQPEATAATRRRASRRFVLLEYVMLRGVNDRPGDAQVSCTQCCLASAKRVGVGVPVHSIRNPHSTESCCVG